MATDNITTDGLEFAYCPACGNIVYRNINSQNDSWLLWAYINDGRALPEELMVDNLPDINCGCNG